uniref:Pyrroline-5-carboxylate reductase n=1 Tax=Phakopsora pachyrhizi TaxID=170000 RepID=A0A0S1MKG7_PHAPC
MASSTMPAKPAALNAASAAAVVPPLEVTRSRSTDGGSDDSAASLVAPAKVPSASWRACSAVRPTFWPPAIRASRNRKT